MAQKHPYSTATRETNRGSEDALIFKLNEPFDYRIWHQVCVLSHVTKKFAVPETLTFFFFFPESLKHSFILISVRKYNICLVLSMRNCHNFYFIMQTPVIAGHLYCPCLPEGSITHWQLKECDLNPYKIGKKINQVHWAGYTTDMHPLATLRFFLFFSTSLKLP